MAKAKQRFSWTYNHEAGTAEVKDNETESVELYDYNDLPETIRDQVAVYGLGKVLQDRNSGTAADEKLAGMTATYTSLAAGQWKAERTFGARLLPAIIEVIGKAKGCTVTQAQAAWRACDDAMKLALKEKFAEECLAIEEARKATDEVTLDDLV